MRVTMATTKDRAVTPISEGRFPPGRSSRRAWRPRRGTLAHRGHRLGQRMGPPTAGGEAFAALWTPGMAFYFSSCEAANCPVKCDGTASSENRKHERPGGPRHGRRTGMLGQAAPDLGDPHSEGAACAPHRSHRSCCPVATVSRVQHGGGPEQRAAPIPAPLDLAGHLGTLAPPHHAEAVALACCLSSLGLCISGPNE
ncbi:uncharacterized protein LOC123522423 isoform X2 [Echinops telfairi]|uniref:Uncharacterized protein LOC123522423 isoform X2 n=2 Tax=Echinops telfairi TaxID=9371 RepID=A0AC55DKX7_ECHTE|nr:uncharacterized protein LOC123522423 isoform X2 [Echinops telfairi]XP_045152399.1 uncharacterized protein LOC123522423 isoform X2 [Echinops telfairi]